MIEFFPLLGKDPARIPELKKEGAKKGSVFLKRV